MNFLDFRPGNRVLSKITAIVNPKTVRGTGNKPMQKEVNQEKHADYRDEVLDKVLGANSDVGELDVDDCH